MEKDRGFKVVAIVALVIAVIGLSIGFAAFSTTLTIAPAAEVHPENSLKVEFSATDSSTPTTATVKVDATGSATGTAPTISNSGATPQISNFTATFTEPGETVTYTFYAVNTGEWDAYLKNIAFGPGTGQFRTCAPKTGAGVTYSADEYEAACNSINVKISVGGKEAETSTTVSSHKLAKTGREPIVLTISYDEATDGSSNLADGDFTVSFQPITLTYSTVDGN